jgi:hypothetical protein
MEISELEVDEPKPWQLPGIERIEFDVRILYD